MRASDLTPVDELTLALACAQPDTLLVFRTTLNRTNNRQYMSWSDVTPYTYKLCVRHFTMATDPWRRKRLFYDDSYEQPLVEYIQQGEDTDAVVQVLMLTGEHAARNTCALCTKRYGALRKRYGEHINRWIAITEQEDIPCSP